MTAAPAPPSRLDTGLERAGQLDFVQRCRAYLDDAPGSGGHSDAAGSNAYELIEEAIEHLAAPPAVPAGEEVRLRYVIEYSRRDGSQAWIPMAAFDFERPAEAYLKQQRTDEGWPWIYRLSPSSNGKPATENEG